MPVQDYLTLGSSVHPWASCGIRRIRFGISEAAQSWPEIRDLAQMAEGLGFDSFWPVDHPMLGLPGFLPSTTAAMMELLERAHKPLEGRRVVVINRINVVGKPLALLLLHKHATVLICHLSTTHLAAVTCQADVLIVAAGQPGMVTAEMVKPGAVVIAVGNNALHNGGIVGDVDIASVREIAGAITPVPGGVGPLTNVLLLKQCVQAAWQLAGENTNMKSAA